MSIAPAALEVGSTIEPLTFPPITRTVLAVYCGASGDHNPVHVDIDAARGAGYADVFAHGMLSMAYLGRLLTNTFEQFKLVSFGVRFTSITQVNDVVTCTGRVVKRVRGRPHARHALSRGEDEPRRHHASRRGRRGPLRATRSLTVRSGLPRPIPVKGQSQEQHRHTLERLPRRCDEGVDEQRGRRQQE